MSSYSGPNEVTNGLVFQYDMGNTKKSWLGPPSVNLCLNDSDTLNGTNWYAYCAGNTNNITYNTTDIKDPEGNYTATKIVRDSGTVCGATGAWGLIWGLANVTAGVTYTISIWACAPVPMSVWFAMNDAGGGGSINLTSTWQRFTFTSALPASGTGDRGLQFIMPAGSGTAYFWGAQLEQTSFMTPYMSTTKNQGSRTTTTAVKDLTSINTITASSLTYASDNTFTFNGSTDYFEVPSNSFFDFTNGTSLRASAGYTWTVEAWFKFPVAPVNAKIGNAAYVIVGASGVIGGAETFTLFVGSGTDSTYGSYVPYYCAVGILGAKTIISPSPVNTNTWNHVAVKWDGSSGRVYFNGVDRGALNIGTAAVQTGYYFTIGMGGNTGVLTSAYCYEGSISTVRVYSISLSSNQIIQNFNSLRGRFGL